MDAVMQKEVLIAIIVAVVVIVAIIAGRGLRISRRQLILDPRKDPQQQTKVDLLNDAKLEDSEMGNMTGTMIAISTSFCITASMRPPRQTCSSCVNCVGS